MNGGREPGPEAPLNPPIFAARRMGGDLNADLSAVTVLCGDCRKIIPALPEGLVRMLLTDPPYGMGYQTNRTAQKGKAILGDQDLERAYRMLTTVVAAVSTKLQTDAWYYLFSNDKLRDLLITADAREVSEECQIEGYDEIIWAKPVGSGDTTNSRYRSSYERVLVFRKGQPKLNGHPGNLIWADRPGKDVKLHPAQKALYGLAEMIEQATQPGDVILDPFAGSGSTAAAMCVLLPESEWRKVILIEQDPELCEQIVRRLSPYTKVSREL